MADKPGRPPKTPDKDFPTDWERKIISRFKRGASQAEIQAFLDISDKTFTRLMKENKQFFRTIKRGLLLSQAWWERQGRTNLKSKDFNHVLWYMNMKNRFNWRDRSDITSDDGKLEGLVIYKPEQKK